MSKQDLEDAPEAVPKKRRQMESVPDVWLAQWLDRDLAPGDRKRVEQERERRKEEARRQPQPLGILIGDGGITPAQLHALWSILKARNGTVSEVHHPGVASKVHSACRSLGVKVHVHEDLAWGIDQRLKAVVKESSACIAFPEQRSQQAYADGGVWGAVGACRHRSVPVLVVHPDGTHRS